VQRWVLTTRLSLCWNCFSLSAAVGTACGSESPGAGETADLLVFSGAPRGSAPRPWKSAFWLGSLRICLFSSGAAEESMIAANPLLSYSVAQPISVQTTASAARKGSDLTGDLERKSTRLDTWPRDRVAACHKGERDHGTNQNNRHTRQLCNDSAKMLMKCSENCSLGSFMNIRKSNQRYFTSWKKVDFYCILGILTWQGEVVRWPANAMIGSSWPIS
jgi:hypothetical protein